MNLPSNYQKKLITKMLKREFPGVEALRDQARDFKVEEYGGSHDRESFRIIPGVNSRKAEVNDRVPVEGVAKDSEGIPIDFLLHVVDGYMSELEVVMYSDIKTDQPIDLNKIQILTHEEKSKSLQDNE